MYKLVFFAWPLHLILLFFSSLLFSFLETYFFFYVEIIINDQQWIYFTVQFTLLLSDII
jgi:Na+/melibiose symporter-like transporter